MKIYRWVGTAALAFFPSISHADGPDSFSIGSRGAGLGGALAGGADDWSAGYYNPAGFAVPRSIKAGAGIVVGVERLDEFQDIALGRNGQDELQRGPVGADYEDVYAIVGGIAIPLTKRLSMGMTIWSPAQRFVRIMTQDPFIPHYPMQVNRAQRITFDLAFAYRITDKVRVGLGGAALARSSLNVDFNIPAGEGSDENQSRGLITLDIVPTFVPVAGVEWDVGDFMIGAAYRGETDLKVKVDQSSGSQVIIQFGPTLRFRSTVAIAGDFLILDHFTPQQVALGGKWGPSGAPVHLYLDATWMNWARFRGPYIDPNFDDITVPPIGTVAVNWRRPPPANYRDTIVPRIGAEWRLGDVAAVRGGYSYEMTPAPLASGEANLLDANAHVGSLGLGLTFRDPTRYVKNPIALNLHARVRHLESTTVQKRQTYDCDDPDADVPTGYPCSGGRLTYGGQIVSGGADLTFDF